MGIIRKLLVVTGFSVILLAGIGVGLYFVFRSDSDEIDEIDETAGKGAVATSILECTEMAVEILKNNGSAVDAAITAAFCQGLTVPQSCGLGGGFIAMVYIKDKGYIETLNSREVAPGDAHKDMYTENKESLEGGLAIAVPTEVKGLYELHKKYEGKFKWAELIQPVIDLAKNGYKVSNYLAAVFRERDERIRARPLLKEFFTDPNTGEYYKEGDLIKNPKLAETFKVIAEEGSDAIYGGGSLGQKIVDDIQDAGGIIKISDLTNYKPKWGKPIESKLFNGDKLNTFPLPTAGATITFALNIMNGYKVHEKSWDYHKENKLYFHRVVESLKFAFGKRSKLGDEDSTEVLKTLKELESTEHADNIRKLINDDKTFNDASYYLTNSSVVNDYGTAHISILAPNGDAVAFTSTINSVLGSYVMSESTGILFNNEMNDFSIPVAASDGLLPAPSNYIAPGKSPMSSMSPLIVLNSKNEPTLVLGGAGGILIASSMVQVLLGHLYLGRSLKDSIDEKRLHHQLQPMVVRLEDHYDSEIIAYLKSKGHVTFEPLPIVSGFASMIGISKKNNSLEAAVDPRRGGAVEIF